MVARGAAEKTAILKGLKLLFPAMFSLDGKEWRIPIQSNGERLEFKIALTCAKENIGGQESSPSAIPQMENGQIEFTEEEIQKCRNYLKEMRLL